MENNIKKIRKASGLTLEQLAQRAGTSFQQIYKLENSERRLTVEWAERIASALSCSLSDIIGNYYTSPVTSIGLDEELLEKCYDIVERKADELKVKFKKKELIKASIALYKIAVRDKAAGQDNISVGAALSIIENIKDTA